MKLDKLTLLTALVFTWTTNAISLAESEMDMEVDDHGNMMTGTSLDSNSTSTDDEINWATATPVPHESHHMHGVPILETDLTPLERKWWESYNTTTYFTIESDHKFELYTHLFIFVTSFTFFYPIILVLNNLSSNWFLPALTVFCAANLVSLFSYSVFINSVPDLYPGNAYSKMNTGLFFFLIIHLFASVIVTAKKWLNGPINHSLLPTKDIQLQELNQQGAGSNSPSSTLFEYNSHGHNQEQISNDSFDLESRDDHVYESESLHNGGGLSDKRNSIMNRFFEISILQKSVAAFGSIATFVFNISNYGLFFYFLVHLPTGVACLNTMGQGVKVFNLLAHFIKGGVFFAQGILALARYSGAFTKLGGSWNCSYISKFEKGESVFYRIQPKDTMITFEMLESSLILFYGCTNIFLERLANKDGAWTAKDLQHVSIAFMYIGSGLCGVITELKLAQWRKDKFYDQVGDRIDQESLANVTPGFSPNPFPAFTIFWTGLLMSQHAQASELSTKVHVQWGALLTYGSLFRILTFLMMMYFPIKNKDALLRPSRPLTELVSSFCLLCGGLVFMESTDQCISAMEYRGLTPMFTINVSVGVIALVMAWIMTVFAFKDWLKKRMYG